MQKQTSLFLKYLLAWFVINLLQAYFSEPIHDETYYWEYANNLAWGYFDHPPAIAWLIAFNKLFFSGIFAIRFSTVLLMSVLPLAIWQLIPKSIQKQKNTIHAFFALLFTIPGFHIYSFVSTPDVPLLIAFTLYLYVFNNVIYKQRTADFLLWGIAAALLIYAKYHGGILIFLSLVIKWRLLLNPRSYLAGLVAILLLWPHLFWLHKNNYITFYFHLYFRPKEGLQWTHVLGYLGSVLIMLNPILIYFFGKAKRTFKANRFDDKTIKQLTTAAHFFIGFVAFFFLYSFRSRIEPHWVVAGFIPLVIYLTSFVAQLKIRMKPLLISIIAFSVVRILIALPLPFFSDQFHRFDKPYYTLIHEKAKDLPVVFVNSYETPSKFHFYTRKKAYSESNIYYRKTQYDLWDKPLHNQTVFYVGNWPSPIFNNQEWRPGDTLRYRKIDSFQVLNKVTIRPDIPLSTLKKGVNYTINVTINNKHKHALNFKNNTHPYQLGLFLKKDGNNFFVPITNTVSEITAKQSLNDVLEFTVPHYKSGDYRAFFVIKPGNLYPIAVSRAFYITLTE